MDIILKLIGLLIVLVILYNVITPLKLFKKKEYEQFPYLKDTVSADQYEIAPIEPGIVNTTTYDPRGNYFILACDGYYLKLNDHGQEAGRVPRFEKSELPRFSHFIIDSTGIYDVSKERVQLEQFKTIINADRLEDPFKLRDIIKPLYEQAEIVLFSKELSYAEGAGYCIYFKIQGNWTKLFTEKRCSQLNVGDLYPESERPKGYISRYPKLIPLKDTKAGVFSDHRMDNDWYLVDPADYNFSYRSQVKIKDLYLEREHEYGTIPYTTIPLSWASHVYYRLTFKNQKFHFQEKGVKHLFGSVQHFFQLFELPEQYQKQCDVWFLVYNRSFNVEDTGCEGTYVVRKKK